MYGLICCCPTCRNPKISQTDYSQALVLAKVTEIKAFTFIFAILVAASRPRGLSL